VSADDEPGGMPDDPAAWRHGAPKWSGMPARMSPRGPSQPSRA